MADTYGDSVFDIRKGVEWACHRSTEQPNHPIAMNELKAKLKELGLSDEIAEQAIHTVGEFVKGKLPQDLHGTIDDVLAGKSPDLGGLLGNLGGLGGLFGK